MMGWGRTIRKWYGRVQDQQLDISNNYIGYYTDNGKSYILHTSGICFFNLSLLCVCSRINTFNRYALKLYSQYSDLLKTILHDELQWLDVPERIDYSTSSV